MENDPESGIPKYAGRDVAAAADGNHKVWLEVVENAICGRLAQFVNLQFAALARPQSIALFVSALLPYLRSVGIGKGRKQEAVGRWLAACWFAIWRMNRRMSWSNEPHCRLHRLFEPC